MHLIEVLKIFGKKSSALNLNNRLVDFHKIGTAGTYKLVDVQCKFVFKSDITILSYDHFKFLVQACPG